MYKIEITNRYKQSVKKAQKSGYNISLLTNVIQIIANGETLPSKYKNHPLKRRL